MRLRKSKVGKDRFLSNQNYAQYEYELTREVLIPLLKKWGVDFRGKRLLDVGCALGGSTIAFGEDGSIATGIDIKEDFVRKARKFARNKKLDISFIQGDICSPEVGESIEKQEIIILRDVIEHVPAKKKKSLISNIVSLLWKEGICFVSFPPFYSPFGGHQQYPKSIINFLPYVHLLPLSLELKLLSFNSSAQKRMGYREWGRFLKWRAIVREEKVSIASFRNLISLFPLKTIREEPYLIRPVFSYRYGLSSVKNLLFGKVPGLKELTTTGALYLLKKEF